MNGRFGETDGETAFPRKRTGAISE